VAIPDDHFVGASVQETFNGSVQFPGQQSSHLGFLRVGLILAADPGHAFGIGNDEDALQRLLAEE
jgi:hypothetical protein